MTNPPKVIINADDFGYSEGVNQGVIKAYTQGVLTSTTVLANTLHGNENLQPPNSSHLPKPPLGIGVHLDLTYGKPVSPKSWKEKKFTRPQKGEGIQLEWQNKTWEDHFAMYDEKKVKEEFHAQIEKVKETLGFVDHLDSHHSVASFGPIRKVYLAISSELNLPVRPFAHLSKIGMYGGDFIVEDNFPSLYRKKGIKTVDSADMSYYYKLSRPIDAFCNALATIKHGELREFMFHPAVDASVGEWRIKDLEILTHPKTKNAITNLGIQLTTYAESAY